MSYELDGLANGAALVDEWGRREEEEEARKEAECKMLDLRRQNDANERKIRRSEAILRRLMLFARDRSNFGIIPKVRLEREVYADSFPCDCCGADVPGQSVSVATTAPIGRFPKCTRSFGTG